MIIDSHTDVLWKMIKDPTIDFYSDSEKLNVNYPNMVAGNINVQIFAIFVSALKTAKFSYAIQSVDDFYQKILDSKKLNLALNYKQIEKLLNENKKVALLSLEGADALEGDLGKLRIFHKLGVRAVGLTWNFSNEAADGILEKRGAGLTEFGYQLIKELNKLGMMIDLSHISVRGFWDVLETSESPVMASHSNSKYICNHPRNLADDQIKAIIKTGGIIGVTYVKQFVADKKNPSIEDLVLHIEHIAELGGINNIGLGSDFDGGLLIKELNNPALLDNLINLLGKKFNDRDVEAILGGNWLRHFRRILK